MEKRDNYAIAAQQAQELFLKYDQQRIIEKFGLRHDREYLYLGFAGREYRISRRTGEAASKCLLPENCILQAGDAAEKPDGAWAADAGYSKIMSIFDFLCHDAGPLPEKSGRWAPVNSVDHQPKTVGVEPFHLRKYAKLFDASPEKLAAACEALGGEKKDLGDIGYEIPVFFAAAPEDGKTRVFISARIKFYCSDEEFDAQLTLLWDTEILRVLKYETMFYVEGCICEELALRGNMKEQGAGTD